MLGLSNSCTKTKSETVYVTAIIEKHHYVRFTILLTFYNNDARKYGSDELAAKMAAYQVSILIRK